MTDDPARYFSATYAEAAARFREAAKGAGVAVEAWTHPRTGPAGENLETLVCEIGPPDAANLMVLNSGTHGTEAMVGAGVLTGLLHDIDGFLAGFPDTRVTLIHVINPYGAAWSRYVNEDNVDLMKNFLYGEAPTPPDPLFVAFDDLIDLAHASDPQAVAAAIDRRNRFVETHGMATLMACLKKGQSDRPKSMCFNGRGAAWSTRTLNAILSKTVRDARQVLFVDLHSGVGAYGEAYVIATGPGDSAARMQALLGERAHTPDLVTAAPLYSPQGALAPNALFTAVIIEGGTVSFDDSFRETMWLEMHHHMYGDPTSPEAIENSRRFRAFYYPESDDWRRTWWGNCREMLATFLGGMQAWRRNARAA